MLLTNTTHFLTTTYDLLILGAGTSGSALAHTLATRTNLTIGILEAGLSRVSDPLIHTPGKYGFAESDPVYDWIYRTTPQSHVNNRSIVMSGGKMLGGSSGLNYMFWNTGHWQEYDTWEALGNPGWGAEGFLPYVRKAEMIQDPVLESQLTPEPPFQEEKHGRKGQVKVSHILWNTDLGELFLPTQKKLGVRWNPDPFGGDNEGFAYPLTSVDQDTARRSYAEPAYITPIQDSPRVQVLTGVTVGRIVLDKGNAAIGVEFWDSEERMYTVRLKRGGEVVVSAGTLGSPKILELSGIGKKSVLDKVGIPVKVRNDYVGENLQDHLYSLNTYKHRELRYTRDLLLTDPTVMAEAQAAYDTNRTGIFTSVPFVPTFLPLSFFVPARLLRSLITRYAIPLLPSVFANPFLSSALPRSPTDDTPQMELIMSPHVFTSSIPPSSNTSYLTMIIGLLHPLSRGSTHINSSNPLLYPEINPRFLSHPLDLAVLREGSKFGDKVARTEPLAGVLGERVGPAGEVDDEGWEENVRRELGTIKHPIGTCAMAPKGKEGVVDERLRVYGTNGVRVVDASVMPVLISAHTQATAYGIGLKGADLLLEDLGY